MPSLEIALLSATIIMISEYVSGARECRNPNLRIHCYDCDSRFDRYCADPFNTTLPPEHQVPLRLCSGCCIKFLHKIPNNAGGVDKYVQRSCTESIKINYFMVDHVCMSESQGRGQLCFCEDHYCNGAGVLQFSSVHCAGIFVYVILASFNLIC